jgi:hypothetical protein
VSDQIADWIRDDADNQFKRHYIRNRPDANFQAIALGYFNRYECANRV